MVSARLGRHINVVEGKGGKGRQRDALDGRSSALRPAAAEK
jgi:hypothetical protein